MNIHQRASQLERQLAEAQGHEVAFVASSGTVWIRLPDGDKHWMPRPTRDVADCMNLMLAVGVWPREAQGVAGPVFEVVDADGWVCHIEPIGPDDDKKSILMLAVVAGAIERIRLVNARKEA
jgi:hypothetical protein